MIEVFYRANVPEEQRDEKTEYYTLVFIPIRPGFFIVSQHHGWWDPELQRSRHAGTQLMTIDEPLSEAEGRRIYLEQRSHILSLGFTEAMQIADDPSGASWPL
jgi:hypothetical protein